MPPARHAGARQANIALKSFAHISCRFVRPRPWAASDPKRADVGATSAVTLPRPFVSRLSAVLVVLHLLLHSYPPQLVCRFRSASGPITARPLPPAPSGNSPGTAMPGAVGSLVAKACSWADLEARGGLSSTLDRSLQPSASRATFGGGQTKQVIDLRLRTILFRFTRLRSRAASGPETLRFLRHATNENGTEQTTVDDSQGRRRRWLIVPPNNSQGHTCTPWSSFGGSQRP